MNLIEQPYVTPPGKYDFPFAYVYDATALTDGSDYQDIQIPMQGDSDFILRHIAGVNLCVDTAANGGRFNYKNPSRQYAIGNPSTGIVFPKNWPVLPEKLYKFNEAIWIDLYKVLRDPTACDNTIYNSFIAFFGVKRFDVGAGYISSRTPYKYKEMPQRYEYVLTIDWNHFASGTSTPQQPHRFIQQMDNYDFELLRITVGQEGIASTVLLNDFSMTLYDQSMHQLSNLPLNQGFFNAGKPSPALQPPYQACFPVPSMVYPAGSAITFDVTSMICDASPRPTYNISFEGIWRLPC